MSLAKASVEPSLVDDAVLVVSPRRARQLLDVSQATLYELLYSGELENFRIGKSRKITLASIHRLIARRLAARDERLGAGRAFSRRGAEFGS
jgi:hypothetical protein